MTRLQAVRCQIGAFVSVREAEEAIAAADAEGMNLALAWPRFAVWLLRDELAEWATVDSLTVAELYHRVISGNSPTRQEWEHALRAVDAAAAARVAAAAAAAATIRAASAVAAAGAAASAAAASATYAADVAYAATADAAKWAASAFDDRTAAYERQAAALTRCVRACDGSATQRPAESPALTHVCPRCSHSVDSTLDGLPFCRHCGSATKWLRPPRRESAAIASLVGADPYTPRLCTRHGLTACMCSRHEQRKVMRDRWGREYIP